MHLDTQQETMYVTHTINGQVVTSKIEVDRDLLKVIQMVRGIKKVCIYTSN